MLRITNLKLDINHNMEDIINEIIKNVNTSNIYNVKISSRSIDARKKNDIKYIYSVDFESDKELYDRISSIKNLKIVEEYVYKQEIVENYKGKRPVIIGTGPAGMLAGIILAKAGLKPILIERGKAVKERVEDVYTFFEKAILDEESNVQYGEGGAGTFSDGKLTTNTHNIRINKVIEELILSGAKEEIRYISKPHLGTDELVIIVENIRKRIEELGGEYRFNTKFIDFNEKNNELKSIVLKNLKTGEEYTLETDYAILAIGHSARDTFELLYNKKINMEKKPFSIGVRVEHKQDMINKSQYGELYNKLPAAEYKLHTMSSNKRGVYTFCMCPGGVVVPSSSEKNRLVVNGMSYSKRDLENANSAVLVNIFPSDLGDHILSGMYFQRELEEKAFILGGNNYKAPVQLVKDYIKNVKSTKIGNVKPSYSIGYNLSNLNEIFPDYVNEALKEGFLVFDRKLKGFANQDAIITAIESRSSSPIRIIRNEEYDSSIKGIIPCGEGAGYAGGIMSAAVDGIRMAEIVIDKIKNEKRESV